MSSKPEFNRAAETPKQKRARLEAQAKALDEMLRKPPTQTMRLTPTGSIRRAGDDLAKQEVTKKRVDVAKELEALKSKTETKTKLKAKERSR